MTIAADRWTLPDLRSAVEWCKMRNNQGIRCVMDILGEYTMDNEQVSRSAAAYIDCVRSIKEEELKASITVKLTALGALYDKSLCRDNVLAIFREASANKVDFEMDMEGQRLIQFTLDTAIVCAGENLPPTLALQAYLNRSQKDLTIALSNRIKLRLVKGAYLGDTDNFEEIQMRFREIVETILKTHLSFNIGTHDPELIHWTMKKTTLNKSIIEFCFLRGLSDQTKVDLVRHGWTVSEYVPFGKGFEAYKNRRLKYLRDLDLLKKQPAP